MGEKPDGRRVRRSTALAAAVALLIGGPALGGCSASPKSSYLDSAGKEVTVDWKSYPGHAGIEAEDVLDAPVAEELEERASEILPAVEARLTAVFGLQWEDGPGEQEPFHRQGGNGYGGDSLYQTFNSVSRESLGIPQGASNWRLAASAVGGSVKSFGFGPIEWDSLDTTRTEENKKFFGSDDPDTYWRWGGHTSNGSEWIMVDLVDVEKDPSGKAAKDYQGPKDYGWNPRSITISYGATTIRGADKEAFLRALEPFRGLVRPEATSSD